MCPAKWQTQYGLTEKTALVNTRALLLILEKIENNAEVETKPPGTIKPKGAEGKCKMESIDSRILKKPKQVGFSDKQCALFKKQGGPYKSHYTHDCRKYNSEGTPSKGTGAQILQVALEETEQQISTVQIKENANRQILLR
jgi:hypothetical protein